jgi:hypothetical protein
MIGTIVPSNQTTIAFQPLNKKERLERSPTTATSRSLCQLTPLLYLLEHRYRSEAHGIQEIKGSSKQESDITQRS